MKWGANGIVLRKISAAFRQKGQGGAVTLLHFTIVLVCWKEMLLSNFPGDHFSALLRLHPLQLATR